MIVRAKNFKGYSSKPDDLIDHPEILHDCSNIIINQGDICNMPFMQKRYSGYEDWNRLSEIFELDLGDGKLYNIIITLDNKKIIFRRIPKEDFDEELIFEFSLGELPSEPSIQRFYPDENFLNLEADDLYPTLGLVNNVSFGKLFKMGDFIYIFGKFTNRLPLPNKSNYKSRMLRFKIGSLLSYRTQDPKITRMLVGIEAPKSIVFGGAVGSGSFTGTYNFGIGFVSVDRHSADQAATLLYTYDLLDDVESNVVIDSTERELSSENIVYTVYYPYGNKGEITKDGKYLGDKTVLCTTWVKDASAEELFYFNGLVVPSNPVQETSSGLWRSTVVISTVGVDRLRMAPLSGRSVPKAIKHFCYFKGRLYSSYYKELYWEATISGTTGIYHETKNNYLQISPSINELQVETATIIEDSQRALGYAENQLPNYVDELLEQAIGDSAEDITGIVEFLGRMIIFKEFSTYILNDDIKIGSIVRLFNDIGCINKDGCQAYLVINNVLYFFSNAMILYAWDGGDRPIPISEPIRKDLEENVGQLRKGFANLSFDERYGLLYLSFLDRTWSYIYHINEGGAWTKIPKHLIKLLRSPSGKYWENQFQGLIKQGNLEDAANMGHEQYKPEFSIGKLTGGDSVRKKQWKEFVLDTQTPEIGGNWDCTFNDINQTIEGILTRRLHLGLTTEYLDLTIKLGEIFKYTPFRINGFSITGKPVGRR